MRVAAIVVALLASVVPAPAVLASGAGGPHFADGHGLRVVGVTRFDARDYNVRVLSPALGRPVNVRVLLPVAYAEHPARRYPVLYLFHGTSGTPSDWIDAGDAAKTTAPYQLITVLPEEGFDGDGGFWFTNWVDRTTTHGPGQYEDFFIESVIPWVDANLRTDARREARAIAGLSQGGYGSSEMAARHPDLFASMASFSGAPEIARDPDVYAGAIGIVEAIEVGDDQVPPFSMLGDPATDRINWQGHDPATLIENLRGMRLYLWTGEGVKGPYDGPVENPGAAGIEGAVYTSTRAFHSHLVDEGIPAFYDDYVYGTHSWPYWARDLRAYVPMMMRDFAHPTRPAAVSYTTIDKAWTQWGYTVSIERPATLAFSTLSAATPTGFDFAGSGSAVVTTPAVYRPNSRASVQVSGGSHRSTERARVGRDGRLELRLPLGDGAAVQVAISAPGRG